MLSIGNRRFEAYARLLKHIRRKLGSVVQRQEIVRDSHGKLHELRRTNANLERYYREQGACASDEEWSRCLSAMRRNLPQGFRINAGRPQAAKEVKALLESKFWETDVGAHERLQLRRVDPAGLIWQANADRWKLKQVGEEEKAFTLRERTKSGGELNPEFDKFYEFLIKEHALGNIARQELVSMTPVLCLDLQPHHRVLDMCASPGSKSKQVLESLGEEGFLIANELKAVRCFRLASEVQKVGSRRFILVNHDGRYFPEFIDADGNPIRYDRIVCDQPCSGDGTIRKNPSVWDEWSPSNGNQLHKLQYDIAKRGLCLLKTGGLFAYSSCSMNPVENEAVLSRLLQEADGALEIVDCKDQLEARHNIKSAPGFTDWTVFDGQMNSYKHHDEVPDHSKTHLPDGLFPPSCEQTKKELSKAMRFLPHHNDCGGFFLAVLRKTGDVRRWEDGKVDRARLERTTLRSKISGRTVRNVWKPASQMNFCGEEQQCDLDFYGLDLNSKRNLFSTTGGNSNYHVVGDEVGELLLHNHVERHVERRMINIFAAGVPVFAAETKATSPVGLAVNPRHSHGLVPSVRDAKRTVEVEQQDFQKLLEGKSVVIEGLSNSCQVALSKMSVGPVLLKARYQEQPLRAFGFKGQFKLMLNTSETNKYHLRMVLQNLSQ